MKCTSNIAFFSALLVGLLACGNGLQKASAADVAEADLCFGSEKIPCIEGLPVTDSLSMATGAYVQDNGRIALDYSNAENGYIIIRYLDGAQKVKIHITGQSGITYTYDRSPTGNEDVFALSDGSGPYKISVSENTNGSGYTTVFSYTINVVLKDEFAAFLRTNKYVNYSAAPKLVAKAGRLCGDQSTVTAKIKAVYNYVIGNYSYDYEQAGKEKTGYVPDLDKDFALKKGTSFDYAATLTAMLRSQGVPTKMVFAYTGSVYQAWISTYSKETDWVTGSICFDGQKWELRDPGFAATQSASAEMVRYIGNSRNYVERYIY